jgi:hypothetical protein
MSWRSNLEGFPISSELIREVLAVAGLEDNTWAIREVKLGRTSRVFRASTPRGKSYVVKFPPSDGYKRATRESAILNALPASAELAPTAIFADECRFGRPVVVQSWLSGSVSQTLPGERGWERLMSHYAAIHSQTPHKISHPIPLERLNK